MQKYFTFLAFAAVGLMAFSGIGHADSDADFLFRDTVIRQPAGGRQPEIRETLIPPARLEEGEQLSIQDVSRMAMARNLNIAIFRLDQKIKEEDLPIGEALYDIDMTLQGEYLIDEEQPASDIGSDREVNSNLTATLQKTFTPGTELFLEYESTRESTKSIFATLPTLYTGSVEVKLTQPLLRNAFGLVDRETVERIRLDVQAFDYVVTDHIEAEVLGVRTAYWDLVFAHRDLHSKHRALTQANAFLKTTRDKLALGLVEKQDLYASEANVHLRVIDVLKAQTELLNRRELMQVLLDAPVEMIPIPSTEPDFGEKTYSPAERVAAALETRRDLKQLAIDLDRAQRHIAMRKSERLPQLDAEFSYKTSSLDRELTGAQGEIYGFNHPTWFLGVTVNRPWENREAGGRLRQAQLTQGRMENEIRKLRRRIGQEVRDAIRNVSLAASKVRKNRRIEKLQRDKLAEETLAYERGRSDSRTVVDYQEDLIDAETQTQLSLVEFRQATDSLLRAQHGLLGAAGLLNNEDS